jgi:hypothetical protein
MVQSGEGDKYLVNVFTPRRAVPSSKESLQAIKGAVKGHVRARMENEAVDCPVKLKPVSFVECFTCPNFNRRIKGKVGCAGLPLPGGGQLEVALPEAGTEYQYIARYTA